MWTWPPTQTFLGPTSFPDGSLQPVPAERETDDDGQEREPGNEVVLGRVLQAFLSHRKVA